MPRLPTDGTDKTTLGDATCMLTITTNMFNSDDTEQEQETRKNLMNRLNKNFNPYLPELYVLADKVDEIETGNLNLRKRIETLYDDPNCRQAVISVEKQNSTVPQGSDEVFVRVSVIEGA